ncbi:PIN-like domain-containing protein, partial [Lactococcus garvieae]
MDYDKLKELKKFGNDDIKNILDEVFIVFDTSELINLYSYKVGSALNILQAFKSKCPNLYLPAQVQFEFENKREKQRKSPLSSYEKILNQINGQDNEAEPINNIKKNIGEVQKNFKIFYEKHKNQEKHPSISLETLDEIKNTLNQNCTNIIEKIKEDLIKEVEQKKQELETQISTGYDEILEKIEQDFTQGNDYSFKQKLEISYEGLKRYELSIPPGFCDKNKDNGDDPFRTYGDLFIWKQIIDISKSSNKSCILISNDIKSDWNDQKSERKRQPRNELLQEFYEETGNKFWKFTLTDFIGRFLQEDLDASTLLEVRTAEIEKLIADDLEEFESECYTDLIEIINSETDDVPTDAYEWEVDEESIEPDALSYKEIEKIDDDTYQIEYQGTCQVYKSVLCYDYWGRDDDTKEAIT